MEIDQQRRKCFRLVFGALDEKVVVPEKSKSLIPWTLLHNRKKNVWLECQIGIHNFLKQI